jgi:hypothetical protein
MENSPSRHEHIRAEEQEMYEVIRCEDPDRPTVELWTEALSLHRVRYARDVLALDEAGRVVNLGRLEDVYPPDPP